MAHGSSVAKMVASARRAAPSFRAASRRATITAWAVGSLQLLDSIVRPGDHRILDDRDRGDRPFAPGQRETRLCESLAHEQLVVHAADDTGATFRVSDRSGLWNPAAIWMLRLPSDSTQR